MIRFWANACLQVARTYVHRVRFWFAGGMFLFFALMPNEPEAGFVMMSAAISSLLACFVALHLRRQFGGPAAKVVPHFAIPHLVVGAAISLGIWLVVPSIQAWRLGLPAWGPIGAHAVVGLLLAVVVCFRQALLLLVCVPPLLFFARSSYFLDRSSKLQFLTGEYPADSLIIVLLALAAHGVAAVFLLRMSDRQLAVSDHFAMEIAPADSTAGRWNEWWSVLRDAAVGHYLADVGRGLWALKRWRVPVAIAWAQMAVAVAVGAGLAGLTWFASGQPPGALIGAEIAVFGMLFVPLNAWHMRRGAMPLEFTRPVTRERFFTEIALALAVDVAAWALLASGLGCLVLSLVFRNEPGLMQMVGIQLFFLWITAAQVFSLGLATFRLRYWLPVMLFLALAWWWLTIAGFVYGFVHLAGQVPPPVAMAWFAGSAVVTSAAFILLTLWRWRRADVG
jgi:hypothetical protein